jgi:hypothetical protein
MDVQTTLQQAIDAAKAGRKEEARRLLENVLDVEERNEQAWLWLSSVIDEDEDRIICLENVLTVNPRNEAARKGLAALRAGRGTDAASWASRSPESNAMASSEPATDRRLFIVITIALVVLLICIVMSILVFVVFSPMG